MLAQKMEDRQVATRTKIIAAILHYQNNHRGLSPSDEMIAIESGLTRDVVRGQLRKMEQEGMLTDSKRWPRILTIKKEKAIDTLLDKIDPKQKPLQDKLAARREDIARIAEKLASHVVSTEEEEMAEHHRNRAPARPHTRKQFFERAKEVAGIIDEIADRSGGVVQGQEIRERTGMTPGGLSCITMRMVEEGWLLHERKRHSDYKLTNLGRTALLHSGPVEMEVMKAEPVPQEEPREAASEPRTAHPALDPAPVVVVRGIAPERPPAPAYERTEGYTGMAAVPDLSNVDSLDMALELQRRGWRVTR